MSLDTSGHILQQDTNPAAQGLAGAQRGLSDGGTPSRVRPTQFHLCQPEHSWLDAASLENILRIWVNEGEAAPGLHAGTVHTELLGNC